MESLKVDIVLDMELEHGEQLTCGFCCSNNINLVVGTTFGSVYICSYKKNNDGDFVPRKSRLNNLIPGKNYAVTSILMSNFTPDGGIIVAFENGEVRYWHAIIGNEAVAKSRSERAGKIKAPMGYDIADINEVQFDLRDTFDMHDPRGDLIRLKELQDSEGSDDDLPLTELNPELAVTLCMETEVVFGPSSDVDTYFCWTKALRCIFMRRHRESEDQRFV